MVKRNPHVAKLQAGYLFPEIIRRKRAFLEKNPHAHVINLGIGDTTEPLPASIAQQLAQSAQALGTREGYTGYGLEEGQYALRQLIAERLYQKRFEADEVFISDGTNPDIGRLQVLFGNQVTIAVQDPSYPVYIDSAVILGQTGEYHVPTRQYKGITYLLCTPANDFFPSLAHAPRTDLIYFCSPNNPTGAVATYAQLEELVAFARKNHSIIIYDTAYAAYIQEKEIPRSIYEIPGADQVAIELGSFSKMAGFTGVRLGWSVVPKALCFEEGYSVHADWTRVHTTLFNGASNIVQAGGMAALQPEGQQGIQALIRFYMENVRLLRQTFEERGYAVYGGVNAPYLWVHFPHQTSWQAFEALLEKTQIVCAPGSGFGPAGENFLRFSAFGNRAHILEAVERLRQYL